MQTTMTSPAKHYKRSLLVAFTTYAAALFGVNYYLSGAGAHLPQWQMALFALIPMAPIYLFARAVYIFSRSWDELQHRKAMDAVLIAFITVGFGTFAYGFLEGVGFPKLETIWILPMLLAVQGIAQIFVAVKYQ